MNVFMNVFMNVYECVYAFVLYCITVLYYSYVTVLHYARLLKRIWICAILIPF